MRHIQWVALLGLLAGAIACVGPEDPKKPEIGADPVIPSKVTGLTAYVDGGKVRLTWNPLPNADGYLVFRKLTGPAKAVFLQRYRLARYARLAAASGEELADTSEVYYVDAPQVGNAYEYVIAAYNVLGEGPLSGPALANLWVPPPYVDPFASFVHAPFNPPAGDEEIVWPVGVAGGDAGLVSTTLFPAADGYLSCATAGTAIASIRPAVRSPLPSAAQTLAVTFAYDLTEAASIALVVVVEVGEEGEMLAWEEVELGAGCATRTLSSTFDVGALPFGARVFVYAFTEESSWAWEYYREDGPSLSIASSTPLAGESLTGDAPLRLTIDYADLPQGSVSLTLVSDTASEIGQAVTAIAGTGSFAIDLAYHATCGGQATLLAEFVSNDGALAAGDRASFALAATGTILFEPRREQAWLNAVYGYDEDTVWLDLAACDGQDDRMVTLTASYGTIERYGPPYDISRYGTSVSGPIGNSWYVTTSIAELPPNTFGAYPLTITLETSGMAPRAVTIDVDVYGLYWETPPPEEVDGSASFSVAVTGVNLPTGLELFTTAWDTELRAPLSWNGTAYAGTVTLESCGYYGVDVEGEYGDGGHLWGPSESVQVLNSPVYALGASWSWGVLIQAGERVLEEVTIYEACGRSVAWQVVSAPPWVRFASLTGVTSSKLKMVLDEKAAQEVGTFGEGFVYLSTPQAPDDWVAIEVSFAY